MDEFPIQAFRVCCRSRCSRIDWLEDKFKLCSGCLMRHYCSLECQIADKDSHATACTKLKGVVKKEGDFLHVSIDGLEAAMPNTRLFETRVTVHRDQLRSEAEKMNIRRSNYLMSSVENPSDPNHDQIYASLERLRLIDRIHPHTMIYDDSQFFLLSPATGTIVFLPLPFTSCRASKFERMTIDTIPHLLLDRVRTELSSHTVLNLEEIMYQVKRIAGRFTYLYILCTDGKTNYFLTVSIPHDPLAEYGKSGDGIYKTIYWWLRLLFVWTIVLTLFYLSPPLAAAIIFFICGLPKIMQ